MFFTTSHQPTKPITTMLFAALVILVNLVSVFSATLPKLYDGRGISIENPLLPTHVDEGIFTKHKDVPVPVPENGDTLAKTMTYMSNIREELESIWGKDHTQLASGVDKESLTPTVPATPRTLMERIWNTLKRWLGINRTIAACQRQAAIKDISKAIDYELMAARDFKEVKGKQVRWDVEMWIQSISDAVVHQSRAKSAGYGRIDLRTASRYRDQEMRRIMYVIEKGVYPIKEDSVPKHARPEMMPAHPLTEKDQEILESLNAAVGAMTSLLQTVKDSLPDNSNIPRSTQSRGFAQAQQDHP